MNLSFADLIDLGIVRPLMQSFSRTSGLPMSIIAIDGTVLVTSGWQKVCTYFHRRFPLSLQRCIESDTDYSGLTLDGRPPVTGDSFESSCRNGLVHIGFPIFVEGEHLATLFLSQFFYSPPDLEHFRRQALEFGMDEKPYLEAVRQVPILSRERVEEILGFYTGFAALLERLATDRLRQLESRSRLEAALAEAEEAREKIDAILESVGDGLLVSDSLGRIVLMNHAAERLLGISLAASPSRHIDDLLTDERVREQIVAVRILGEGQAPVDWEVGTRKGTGRQILKVRSMPVRTAEGRLSGTVTLLQDITSERELDRLKDEFISTAAHELRTPLTTVLGYVELLLQGDEFAFSPEEEREFLKLIFQKSETLSQIVDDLLDLSRIRSGHLIILKKSREDLVALIGKAVASYREMTRKHLFVLDLPDAPLRCLMDAGKIGQVLENLLSNAVKFSPVGGRITISAVCSDGEIRVTVADQGIGMRPEQIERVFDKFYRVDASTTAVSGLGLGMNIVKSIVEAHGGRIWVESQLNLGTRVHFTLPLPEEEPARQLD